MYNVIAAVDILFLIVVIAGTFSGHPYIASSLGILGLLVSSATLFGLNSSRFTDWLTGAVEEHWEEGSD